MASLISLTFDDGFRCQFQDALPILNRHGLSATFFLIANQAPTHDRWLGHTNDWWKIDWREDDIAMLKEVLRKGHEIGGHSVTHDPAIMPHQPEIEVRESKRLIESWLGTKLSSFCYPFYYSHGYLAEPVKHAGYEQARGGGMPPLYGPQAGYYKLADAASCDLWNVDCRQITSQEYVGGWLRPGCWHVLTYHGIGGPADGWEPITVKQFTAQIEEVARLRDAGEVEVVTFRDGAGWMRKAK
jgi:peptidoglycan/xylan/chitin deacetylase (PgdA/CDA1 family)